jgi:hypothetical protein
MVPGKKSAALLILALLVLSISFAAVSVTKQVSGEKVVDFGEKLHVRISFVSDATIRLEKLEDPVPDEFSALNFPPACSFATGQLTCPFGYDSANATLEYDLVAVGAGQKVVFLPARLSYRNTDGLAESKSSNEIDGVYYVGRALINASVSQVEVDGAQVLQVYALPNSKMKLGVSAKNSGALSAENVVLSLSIPSGWNLTSGKTVVPIGALASGDSRGLLAAMKAPDVAAFSEGTIELNYTVSWKDGGSARAISEPVTIFMVRPELEAKRTISTKWRRTSNGSLQSLVDVSIELRNKGSAEAAVSIVQPVPLAVESSSIVPSLKISGKGSETLKSLSLVSAQKVQIGAGLVNYTDSIGNIYPGFSFQAEEVPIERSVWAAIYLLASPWFPTAQIIAAVVLIGGLILIPLFGKNKYLLLAMAALILAAALLLASTVVIWFGW